jgi:ribosomal protein S18 acetylase RimI-like enzyme
MVEYLFVEPASEALFPEIVALYRAMGWWGDAPDDLASVARLVGGSHAFVAAIDGGAVIGIGRALSDRESDAYIQDVAVRADRRGRGVGGEIVRRLVVRLEDDGIGWVGLVAEPGATHLYQRLGFQPMPGTVAMVRRRQL